MNTNKHTLAGSFRIPLFLILLLFFSACEKQQKSVSEAQPPTGVETVWLEKQPENALPVAEALGAEVSQNIVVTGVIGGVLHPFTEGYASFVVADDALVFCNEMGDDDHCKTPWDACCEDPDKLKKMRATVQILSEDGMPLAIDLKESGALQELDSITVVGEVADGSTPKNLVINATGIYRQS